ncbi:hypothetical protein EYF80_051891 [Liparis tanakae]|uniref:Uncharacterized protein n=1 Tax=Liparis tanakae TaxID=230148 RepID=A0A4Z2F9W4_9TELE|nr:hypothetical protein EYF80_051891 [Liparis tanakae]
MAAWRHSSGAAPRATGGGGAAHGLTSSKQEVEVAQQEVDGDFLRKRSASCFLQINNWNHSA